MKVLDPKAKIFIFKIGDRGDNSGKKHPTFLRMMDLSGETKKILLEKEVGDCGIVIRDRIIFVWKDKTMYALNSKFETIDHPLVTLFNNEKSKDFGVVDELIIHPSLPFAIIREVKYGKTLRDNSSSVWSISWREIDLKSDKPKMVKLFSQDSNSFSFSYDGKWLVFVNANSSPENLVISPVDPDLPYYIGKPIYLGDVPRPENANGDGMTRNPSGLVVSECEEHGDQNWIKKWDFSEAEKLIEKNK
jgi:hypothetical protein